MIELKYPIPILKEGKVEECKFLTVGRLKVKHLKLIPSMLFDNIDKDGKVKTTFNMKEILPLFDEMIPLIASICNIPVEAAKEIDYEDIESVMNIFNEVFPQEKN